jgi:hypothetical protein
MSYDTPEAIAITDKAAQDLMLSELLKVCTPAPWLQDENTIYTLEHYGWRKGEEQFCNRFTASVSAGKKNEVGEVHANAKLIALAPTIAAQLIKERALNAMLLEALKAAKNWHSGDKWRDDCTVEQRAAWEAHRDLLDAAINKAEGVQQ